MKMFNLDTEKETELGSLSSFVISEDQKKMLISMRGKRAVIDLPKGKVKPDDYLHLDNMKVMIDLQEEWTQIYNESWRQMRDFLYDPNMHGVDWDAIHKKYEVLLPFVKNRNDLNYIIGEMIDKKPTIIANVASLYLMIMKEPASEEIPDEVLKNVNVYVSGAAPFPAEAIKDFQKHMKAEGKVLEVY